MQSIPTLDALVRRFQSMDRDTRLETLLDYSRRLPPLPERFHAARDQGLNRVPECQTPVYLFFETDGSVVHIHADVPRESPTVRGYLSLLIKGLDGATLEQVAAIPSDLLERLGLGEALGMMRTQGLSAVTQRLRRLAQAKLADAASQPARAEA
ncbi:MAG: SufE family protein [Gemmatimonadota bacterium]